jgi:hypothetical protein
MKEPNSSFTSPHQYKLVWFLETSVIQTAWFLGYLTMLCHMQTLYNTEGDGKMIMHGE